MKIGISIRIDVTKIDKARLYAGAKGTYLDLTTFIDTDNPDQYENHGFISQSVDKEEREKGVRTTILGNTKVFYKGASEGSQQPAQQPQQQAPTQPAPVDDLGDIPFANPYKNMEYLV